MFETTNQMMLFNCLTCLTIMTRQQRRTWWMLMNYAKKNQMKSGAFPFRHLEVHGGINHSQFNASIWLGQLSHETNHAINIFFTYTYIYHITYYVYTVIHILIYMLHITCMQSHAEQYPSATPVGTKRAHPVEHISETSRIGAKHGRCFFG